LSQCNGAGKKRRSGSKGRAALTSVECIVYLQELEKGDLVRLLPACRHSFAAAAAAAAFAPDAGIVF
jgi:hypothetical protein